VLVAVPGLGTYVNIAITIDICHLCFVAAFAAEDYVLFEYSAFAVYILPDKPFMRWTFGQWPTAGEDVKVSIVIEICHGE
jgi:hypothetical protein